MLSQGVAWFDRHLKGRERRRREQGRDREARLGDRARRAGRAAGDAQADFVLRGTSTARGSALVSRRTAPLQAALETWGSGTARVTVPKLASYPRLVVTVLAGNRVVAHGGLRRAGRQHRPLANYCVFVPKGTRLRVTVGAASPAGQVAYLGFAGAGSATIGPITLALSWRGRSPMKRAALLLALVLASTAGAA